MPQSTARFATEAADRYLVQLTRHFAHRIPTAQQGRSGTCTFDMGTATLRADDTGLDIRIDSDAAEGLGQVRQTVESHLLRFAFRENPQPLHWS